MSNNQPSELARKLAFVALDAVPLQGGATEFRVGQVAILISRAGLASLERELADTKAKLEKAERERDEAQIQNKMLRLWKCKHGGCQCTEPEGADVHYHRGGLFPQLSGWYAGQRGPYENRHAAINAALAKLSEV